MSAQIIRSGPGAGGPAGDQVADHNGGSVSGYHADSPSRWLAAALHVCAFRRHRERAHPPL
jgi:hypothetical protein